MAIAALGIEAGAWLKISVTRRLDNVIAQGRTYHPPGNDFGARVVMFAPSEIEADMIADALLRHARETSRLLEKQFVAMAAAGVQAELARIADDLGIRLITQLEWEALADGLARKL